MQWFEIDERLRILYNLISVIYAEETPYYKIISAKEEMLKLMEELTKELKTISVLRRVKEEIQKALDNYELIDEYEYDISEHLQRALELLNEELKELGK